MADIIRFNGDQHKQTQSLLPWYANGTLDPEEVAAVEAHLADCAECSAELETERMLAREIASLPEQGWASLRARLEPPPARRRPSPGALLRRRVPLGWAMAAQAACLVLVVGGAWIATSQPQTQTQTRTLYRALGSPVTAAAGNVVVMFRPTTSEAELRDALRRSGARVVDGPTVTDAYVLHVAADQQASALTQLRSNQHVVLAEPINGDPQP